MRGTREDLMQWPLVSLPNTETAAKSCKVQDRWVVRELYQTLEEAWVRCGTWGHMAGRAKGLLLHIGLLFLMTAGQAEQQGKSGGFGGEQVKASVLSGEVAGCVALSGSVDDTVKLCIPAPGFVASCNL